MDHGLIKKAGTLAIAALGVTLFAAPSALASTVTVTGGDTVRVAETGNEGNQITVSYDAMALDAATIPSTVTQSLNAASGNDTVRGANVPGTLSGGSGNDAVSGRGTLNGGTGNDTLTGSTLADNLRGSSGRDTLDGGFGGDDLAGGSNIDTLLYPARANGVNVTVGSGNGNDGGPEDQTGGRRDTVHGDIEVVFGTEVGDVLVGDRSAETLVALGGDDFVVGNSGRDTLLGFGGNDLLTGKAGGDVLRGGPGSDRQFGKNGNDRVAGGAEDSFPHGGSGHDVMKGKLR